MDKSKPLHLILAGGLGNQLFQLAYALYCAKPNQEIVIDWSLGKPRLNRNGRVELSDFALPSNCSFTQPRKSYQKILRPSFLSKKVINYYLAKSNQELLPIDSFRARAILFISNFVLSIYFMTRIQLFPGPKVGYFSENIKSFNALVGYFQSYKWPSEPRVLEQLQALKLHLSSDENEEVDKFNNSHSSLVVHLRRGDYKNEHQMGIISDAYFIDNLRKYINRFQPSEILIFTDEPKLIPTEFKKICRNNLIVIQSSLSSVATLQIMRSGTYFIISNSTFSWWGSFLSKEVRNKEVLAPDPWFYQQESPSLILPPDWKTSNPWSEAYTSENDKKD